MPPSTSPEILSVTELTSQIKDTLEGSFPRVWVEGEISDLAKPRSGHLYLTLKDGSSQIRCVMWRSVAEQLQFDLRDGQAVLCFGSVDVYAARGSYQLVIRRMEPQGLGALQLAFNQLQQRLAAEGLFATDRKRPLPIFPRRIGFVTSPTGAAARDFLEVALRRWPGVSILIIPAIVQGNTAPRSIVAGITAANALAPPLDVLVVGRGGGSLEDLWCFNDESVVRAIAASHIPTVSAVGHEIDVTLADFAADVRALTPSAAAELVVPDAAQIRNLLEQFRLRMNRSIGTRVNLLQTRLVAASNRPCFQRPLEPLFEFNRRVDELDLRMTLGVENRLRQSNQLLQTATASLEALSPLATLARGYSITTDASGVIIRALEQVQNGQTITTSLRRGKIISLVTELQNPSPSDDTL